MPSASRKRTRAQSAARKPSAAVNSSTASDSALPDASPEPPSSSSPNARASDGVGHSFDHRRRALLHQLSPLYIPSSLPSLTSQHAALYDLLDRSLTSKANAAALLIGHSGCGKSALTRSVLLHLQRRHAPLGRSFLAVQLSGRLHSDDTVAMREVVRQLTVDLEIEKPSATADFNTLLQYLRDILASSFTSTPVFFVLDHFDLFAAHKAKQTLLYNLCNLLQEEYQLAIIGITQRVDCFELLEKRIKSRLSARRLHFTRIREEEQLLTILRDRLFITAEGLHKALGDRNPFDIDFVPGEVESGLEGVDSLSLSSAVQRHNETVEAALQDEALRPLIQHHMQLGKSVRWFLTWLVCIGHSPSVHPLLLAASCADKSRSSVLQFCADQCGVPIDARKCLPHPTSPHVSRSAFRLPQLLLNDRVH